jgi:aspartate/methionine/tyrosine aminotransferase
VVVQTIIEGKTMPKFPSFARRIEQLPASVYERFRDKFKTQKKNLFRLHIGDTYLHPVYPVPLTDVFMASHDDFNRYCNTFGVDTLRKALAAKLAEDNGLTVTRDNILVTAGATNALSSSMMSLVEPGDDVLILTPCWPFFPGMVRVAGGNVIEAPFYMRLYQSPNIDVGDYLSSFLTPRTGAIYLNSPNNPSGKVLDRGQLEQVAVFAKKHDLWVISDEAYDGLTFDGREHISIATLPGMLERTLSVFTFSKIFMFAGLRLGYVVAMPDTITKLNKIMVHQLYSPSTMAQQIMVEPVRTRREWMPRVQRTYQALRDMVVRELRFDVHQPEGTYFIFFSVEPWLNKRSYWEIVEGLLDQGVAVAPGEDFGKDFGNYIRLCFTGETEERVREALKRMKSLLV